MLLVVGDRSVVQPPMPWPLRVADAWAMPVVASGYETALDGWLGSAAWLRVPDVRVVILAFGSGDFRTAPDDFVAAVAACAYNARARWPSARVVVATPTRLDHARGRRWLRRVLSPLATRLRVDAVDALDLSDLAPTDGLGIAAAVSAVGMTSVSG